MPIELVFPLQWQFGKRTDSVFDSRDKKQKTIPLSIDPILVKQRHFQTNVKQCSFKFSFYIWIF